jgi:N-acetylglucosaminyldiphosphoundecaprenol N-acetyl-beta-D-mannosaminyltransferase
MLSKYIVVLKASLGTKAVVQRIPAPHIIQGVKVHPVTEEVLVGVLARWSTASSPKRAYYVNVYAMNLAHEDERFRDSLNSADVVFCDGYGVWLAAKFQRTPLPERLTPPDWIDSLLSHLSRIRKSVFLLGDEPGIADRCANKMRQIHPELRIAGTHHGFFDINGDENKFLVEAIRDSGASLLLVGMGMPRQELWIDVNQKSANVPLAVPVGALFRWYIGEEKRAPQWVTGHGLEWLSRFLQHPVRHFRRYAIGNPSFLSRVFVAWFQRRFWR